jgi:hypothetical protein
MSEKDVVGLVKELDGLGLKLTAIRGIDGNLSLYKLKTLNYYENEGRIADLWRMNVESDPEVLQDLTQAVEYPQYRPS